MSGEMYNRAAEIGFNNSSPVTDPEDLILWADDTVCLRHELQEMSHMGNDYIVVPYMSSHYDTFAEELFK